MIIYTKKHKIPIQVSECDYEWLSGFTWNVNGAGYVQRNFRTNGKPDSIRMHQMILGIFKRGKGKAIDHINGDKLNNKRENLRIVSVSQNLANRKSKGVRKKNGAWEAYICVDGQYCYLGMHKNKSEAERIFVSKHKEVHGEFSYFNR